MHNLLAEDGSIYVHCDWRVNSYMRLVLDEVFGKSNHLNEISYAYGAGGNPVNFFPRKHDTILWYSKELNHIFKKEGAIMRTPYDQSTLDTHYRNTDESGRKYRKQTVNNIEYVTYADEGKLVTDVWTDIGAQNATSPISKEYTGYPTQKPEKLLGRIIHSSTNEGDLVADFFCGSGTTAAVAEKLGRRWICSDLGKFAIHTTRKRLIGVQRQLKADDKNYRAFALLNLGKYERQYFATVANPRLSPLEQEAQAQQKWRAYVALIVRAYRATEIADSFFHGQKSGNFVAVGPINLPVARVFMEELIGECVKRHITAVDVLAFEFEMGLSPHIIDVAKQKGVALSLKYIPPEVFDKRAVDKGQVAFYDVAHIAVTPLIKKTKNGRRVAVQLSKFSTHYSQGAESGGKVFVKNGQVYKAVKDGEPQLLTKQWSDWVDYWAVDFDYESRPAVVRTQNEAGEWQEQPTGEYVFENEWQSFRTRKNRDLELLSAEKEITAKSCKIAVKVVDIFGNDTMKVLEV